jgi:hypothetical protein
VKKFNALRYLAIASTLLVFVLLTVLGGCAPQPQLHVAGRWSKKVDSDSGFFAYYTGLEANAPTDLRIHVAAERVLERGVSIESPDVEMLYPIVGLADDRIYVRPDELAMLLQSSAATADTMPRHRTLGYFQKEISKSDASNAIEKGEAGNLDKLYWGSLKSKYEEDVKEAFAHALQFAADYGGDALVDIAVSERAHSTDYTGLIFTARAIAFDQAENPDPAEDPGLMLDRKFVSTSAKDSSPDAGDL